MGLINIMYWNPIFRRWVPAVASSDSEVAKALRNEDTDETKMYYSFLREMYQFA
jgi:hypothetical protein